MQQSSDEGHKKSQQNQQFRGSVVTASSLIEYPHTHFQRGLVSVTLGLRFTLSNRHFLGGSMRVKCIASVSPELWRGDRESVVQSMAVRDMREALLLVKSSASNPPSHSRVVFFVLCVLMIFRNCL
ncbi:hypothetical protein WA026_020724 [Henosepilachna vigintioctopunctata]|uniref:Uncharacterized protein n=1 Tax=Henosepilachna vigintioctopunctata TaxID=420089 RepID=A0AAW1U315_9CUCU